MQNETLLYVPRVCHTAKASGTELKLSNKCPVQNYFRKTNTTRHKKYNLHLLHLSYKRNKREQFLYNNTVRSAMMSLSASCIKVEKKTREVMPMANSTGKQSAVLPSFIGKTCGLPSMQINGEHANLRQQMAKKCINMK